MKAATLRVVEALQSAGLSGEVVEFAESTRTAEEAAQAIGTSVERIVKSLIFMSAEEPILALVSGSQRLDTELLSAHVGQAVRRASAAEVREASGFAIGGVAPLGHPRALRIYIDQTLMAFDLVYAAAGTPNSVFPITPADLQRVTGGTILEIVERPATT